MKAYLRRGGGQGGDGSEGRGRAALLSSRDGEAVTAPLDDREKRSIRRHDRQSPIPKEMPRRGRRKHERDCLVDLLDHFGGCGSASSSKIGMCKVEVDRSGVEESAPRSQSAESFFYSEKTGKQMKLVRCRKVEKATAPGTTGELELLCHFFYRHWEGDDGKGGMWRRGREREEKKKGIGAGSARCD